MTSSLTRGSVHAARSVDELIAVEWALSELEVEPLYEEIEPELPQPTAEDTAALLAAQRAAEAAERERATAEAYERGYEDGRREGEYAEGTRLRNAVAAVESALEEVHLGEERWVGSIEENICALAVAIARQVIDRELKTEAGVVDELVRRALREFPVDQPVRVRLNPTDLPAVTSQTLREPGKPPAAADREVTWLADPKIAPGGCVVEGRERIVDGRVDTALERIYRRLTYAHS